MRYHVPIAVRYHKSLTSDLAILRCAKHMLLALAPVISKIDEAYETTRKYIR
jgi:hypothetical protein